MVSVMALKEKCHVKKKSYLHLHPYGMGHTCIDIVCTPGGVRRTIGVLHVRVCIVSVGR